MCGIVGLFYREKIVNSTDEARMLRVLQKISYRGPDGMNIWKSEKILLGHRRLSIIDLSDAGAQPFVDSLHGLVITYNGEIYNYQEIRSKLISSGYVFRSGTDTEVLLYAYDYYGIDFLKYLRGMFSFCLLDQKKHKAILVRDPAGEKPLYYYQDDNQFIFASEIKAFHGFSGVDLEIDAESVKAFLSLQYIPGPHTIYCKVSKLSAGSCLIIDMDNWSRTYRQYWTLEDIKSQKNTTPDEIDRLLERSVRERLIADVEVGLLLSGGIDSSLLAWFAKKAGKNLRVFSASFNNQDLDEVKYAKMVADALGLEQVVIDGGQLDGDTFDKIIFHADEPLGDPACVPTYLLARELSNYVTVVLSGEGADELFWGYDVYRYEKLWNRFSDVFPIQKSSTQFNRMVSTWEGSTRVPAGITRIAKLFSAKYDLGPTRWTSVFADHTLNQIMPSINPESSRYLEEMEARIAGFREKMGRVDGSLFTDMQYWLSDDLLVKVDRMTMAHSVEARAPFLDSDLMCAAFSLRGKYKMNGKQGKLILRNSVEKFFPVDIGKKVASRKKHGFEVPVGDWLHNVLRERAEEQFSNRKISQSGLFEPNYVSKLWNSYLSSGRETPIRRKLWQLLCFQSWFELHQNHFGF